MPVLTAERNVELPLAAHESLGGAAAKVGRGRARGRRPGGSRPAQAEGALRRPGAARRDRARAGLRPALLICDEPTGDLDRKTADEILGLLQVLNRDHGKTIVMVTHDPKAAEFASRTLHLEKGQLLEQAAAA